MCFWEEREQLLSACCPWHCWSVSAPVESQACGSSLELFRSLQICGTYSKGVALYLLKQVNTSKASVYHCDVLPLLSHLTALVILS